nr:ribonuclease P protein component [Microbacterium endophyticum]
MAKPNRLTDGADYKAVVRRGARASGAHTITYVVSREASTSPRFGFIVSKQVGSAVTRNRVRRRLKAVCLSALPHVRAGSEVVIRALPSAAKASFASLESEVMSSLERRAA